jgi:hypothetical protein
MLYNGVEVNTQQTAEPKTIVCPVGGLNGRDSLANMEEKDAYQLDNIFPGTASCEIRPGVKMHQDPVGSPVSSLEVWSGGLGQVMLAFAVPNVLDVTVAGVVTNKKADLAGDEVVATMMSTVADSAQFLIITTGADVPMQFDGLVLTDLAFTGLSGPALELNFVCNYKQRLYFATEGMLGFYYLPPGQIQGALEWFDLGQLSKGGGYLQAIATYSEDAGDGPDDYIVFITSRGECLVFNGLDPGDATAWDIVGRFRAAEPIGRKCVINYAGDLIVLTTEGAQQFSAIRKIADTRYEETALSSKLGSILSEHNLYRDTYGWCMQLWPVGSMFIISVPHGANRNGKYHQFVMNTITQAWCRFESDEWNPQCWAMMGKKLYFGRWDGSVRVVEGRSDLDKPIRFIVKQAYNYFNTPAHKHFKWAQFMVKSDAPVVLASRLSVDYKENVPVAMPTSINPSTGSEWDVDFWDEAVWGWSNYTQRWIAPYGDYGVAASHWLQGDINGATFEWFATEHVFEKASGLL